MEKPFMPNLLRINGLLKCIVLWYNNGRQHASRECVLRMQTKPIFDGCCDQKLKVETKKYAGMALRTQKV